MIAIDLQAAAARVAAKRKELEIRLAQLHQAPLHQKLAAANIVTATIYELLDHQSALNDGLVTVAAELNQRTELLAAHAGCAFGSMPAVKI